MDFRALDKFIHSQGMAVLMGAAAVGGAVAAYIMAPSVAEDVDRGILFPSPDMWVYGEPVVSLIVNLVLTIGLALLITVLNRTYNLQTSPSLLDSAMFLTISLAAPASLMHFGSGTVLCAVVMLCVFILFGTYADIYASKNIFLIFMLLSGMTMTQYAFVVYIPVFITGVAQMRALTARTAVAALLGLLTPWWIVFGLGLASPMSAHLPSLEQFLDFDIAENAWLLTTCAVSASLLVVAWLGNFPRMIAYNAHRRAYNGMMSVLSLVTMLALCADPGDCAAYAPMLFVCTSVQLGKFLSGRLNRIGLVMAVSIIILFILIYLCYLLSSVLL